MPVAGPGQVHWPLVQALAWEGPASGRPVAFRGKLEQDLPWAVARGPGLRGFLGSLGTMRLLPPPQVAFSRPGLGDP